MNILNCSLCLSSYWYAEFSAYSQCSFIFLLCVYLFLNNVVLFGVFLTYINDIILCYSSRILLSRVKFVRFQLCECFVKLYLLAYNSPLICHYVLVPLLLMTLLVSYCLLLQWSVNNLVCLLAYMCAGVFLDYVRFKCSIFWWFVSVLSCAKKHLQYFLLRIFKFCFSHKIFFYPPGIWSLDPTLFFPYVASVVPSAFIY